MDKNRLTQLLQKHHKDAFLWACHCCYHNREDGKEVLQMTYVKIWEGKAHYKKQSSFKTWLFSVIRYTAIDYKKKKHTHEALENVRVGIEETAFEMQTINYKALLNKLPDRQRQVLLLAFYHSMSLTEIASVTQLHIGTVRTHYERGKQAMRTLILKAAV